MNTLLLMGYGIVILGIPEIIIFLLAAIVLGFSIHFFWRGRKSVGAIEKRFAQERLGVSEDDAWRLSYYEQIEQHEKTRERLEKEMSKMRDAERILLIELEETREEVERLERIIEKAAQQPSNPSRHISDLVMAQQNLNEYISKEMTERLEKTYEEFNFLQDRMQKIESQFLFFKEFIKDIQKVSNDQVKMGDQLKHIRELESMLAKSSK
jgi:chromosome segregation ATPase